MSSASLVSSRPFGARWSLALIIVSLLALSQIAIFATNGLLPVVVAPVVLAATLWAVWTLPLRHSALGMTLVALSVDQPGDASGLWKSPLYPIGSLVLTNLNITIPVKALRFSGLDCMVVLLLVVIGYRYATGSRLVRDGAPTPRVLRYANLVSLVTLLVLIGFGVLTGGDFRQVLWQVHQLLFLLVVFYIYDASFRGIEDLPALSAVVLVAACVKASMAMWVRLTVVPPTPLALPTATSHADSLLFALAVVLLVTRYAEHSTRRNFALMALVLPIVVGGMVANNRRLVWVETVIGLAALFVVSRRTWLTRRIARLGLATAPLLLAYVLVGLNSGSAVFKPVHIARSVIVSKADRSTATRDVENFNLFWTFRDHPLLGTGFGHEYVEKVHMDDISRLFAQYRYVPHNSVLGLWAFGGLIGFTGLWLVLVVGLFLAARVYYLSPWPEPRIAAFCTIAAVINYMLQCYGDMGLTAWTSALTLVPFMVVTAKTAVAIGAWPAVVRSSP